MRKVFPVILAALLLAGCVGAVTPGDLRQAADKPKGTAEQLADQLVEISSDRYRGVRVALFATLAGEIMADRARLFDGQRAGDVAGRMLQLEGAVAKARAAGGLWLNADMADVTFVFAGILADVAQGRAMEFIVGGITPGNIIGGVRRAAATSAKGAAMLRDIDRMLTRLDDGELTEDDLWEAAAARAADNKRRTMIIAGMIEP